MKTQIKIILVFLMLFAGTWITSRKVSAQGGSVSYQVFYDDLSPYGSWVAFPNYGYVWVPDVDPGFTPYATNGYWVFTDDGWTWVSYYPWGWAPFHYGRWYTDATYGPVWIPGNEWGPGWVTWRGSEGYYGWAPMGPDAFGGTYNVPYNQWTFVRNGDFGRTNINNYYINNSNNVTIINNSTVINNTRTDKTRNVTYNAGPDRKEVERHAGKTFTPLAIKESNKPGQNLNKNELQMYRPLVQKNNTAGHAPVPGKVATAKDVKPISQRKSAAPMQKANQPAQQKPVQTKPAGQQNQQSPVQTKPAGQQNQQKPAQTKPAGQQNQQRPVQTKPAGQQNQQRPAQTKSAGHQNQQNPAQTKPAGQQNQQRPAQTKPAGQQNQQKPAQTKPAGQQNQQRPVQTKPAGQQNQQKPTQTQQSKPTQNRGGTKQPQQAKPTQNNGGNHPHK
jgi:hypothetical protein